MNDSNDISLADALSGCAYSVRAIWKKPRGSWLQPSMTIRL